MRHVDDDGYLISGETPGFDNLTDKGGESDGGGLVPGHAYSIIQVKEAKDGTRLLNIRNPWGRFEWDGDWGDSSDKWTDEMIEEIKPVLDDSDGAFWMCWEDFYTRYVSINICWMKNWNEIRLKGKFIKCQNAQDPNDDYVMSKFFYTVNSPVNQNIMIGVH